MTAAPAPNALDVDVALAQLALVCHLRAQTSTREGLLDLIGPALDDQCFGPLGVDPDEIERQVHAWLEVRFGARSLYDVAAETQAQDPVMTAALRRLVSHRRVAS